MRYSKNFSLGEGALKKTFEVSQYSGTNGVRIWAKLIKLLGASLAKMVSLSKAKDDPAAQGAIMGEALDAFTQKLDADQFGDFMAEILQNTSVIDSKGKRPVSIDLDFQGQVGMMLLCVKEVVVFNYGDFLAVLGLNIGAPKDEQA